APAGYKTDAKVTITGDCYLQGTVSAGLIVVDPGGADKIIRIALIDFASSNKCDIVVKTYDGTSKARFFIPGNTNADIAAGFTGTKAAAGNFSLKGSVISDYYLKNPADSYTNFLQSSDLKDNIPLSYQPTVEYNPSINIYMNGVGNFVMDGSNVPYTAFIFAPYSTVELKSIGGVPPMIYDGTTVNDRIMVVGVLVSRILKCSNSSNAAILYIDIALSVDNPPPVYRVLTDSDGQKLYARVYPNAEDPIDRVVYPKMVDKTVVEPPMPVEPYVAADYQLACDLYAPAGVAPTGTLFIAPATFKEAKLEYFKELRKFYDSVATPISTKVNVYPNNEVPDTKKFVWYTPFNNDTVTIRTQEYIIRDQYGSDIGGGGTVSLVVERDGVPVTPTVPDSIPQDIKDANPSVDFSLCTITVFDPTLPLGSGLENQLTEYVQDTAHAIPLYLLDTKGNPLVLSSSGDANGDGIGEDDSGDKKYRKEPSGALLLDYDQKPIRIKNASDYNWKNVSR
ncbi:MAG: hypothetical protein LBM93_13595, partial [Oscillospiraceae bacterium]|nr:hypothetical protein [Oscillospiraceae bacterium]